MELRHTGRQAWSGTGWGGAWAAGVLARSDMIEVMASWAQGIQI